MFVSTATTGAELVGHLADHWRTILDRAALPLATAAVVSELGQIGRDIAALGVLGRDVAALGCLPSQIINRKGDHDD